MSLFNLFAGIVLRNDFSPKELFPVSFFLQCQSFPQDHIPVIVKDHLKAEQILVELS